MEYQHKIESKGFDEFIGREIYEEGYENFVSLNLKDLGSSSYRFIKTALDYLCNFIKEGKKVLLSKSPGSIGREVKNGKKILDLLMNSVNEFMKDNAKERDKVIIKYQYPEDDSYILSSRKYEPFTKKQMEELKNMYELRTDLKLFPNPFLYQPD